REQKRILSSSVGAKSKVVLAGGRRARRKPGFMVWCDDWRLRRAAGRANSRWWDQNRDLLPPGGGPSPRPKTFVPAVAVMYTDYDRMINGGVAVAYSRAGARGPEGRAGPRASQELGRAEHDSGHCRRRVEGVFDRRVDGARLPVEERDSAHGGGAPPGAGRRDRS